MSPFGRVAAAAIVRRRGHLPVSRTAADLPRSLLDFFSFTREKQKEQLAHCSLRLTIPPSLSSPLSLSISVGRRESRGGAPVGERGRTRIPLGG